MSEVIDDPAAPPAPAKKKKKSDLVPRLVTAIVAVPILLAIIFAAPSWGFFLLVAAAGAISAWEYCNITYGDELPSGKVLAGVLTVGVQVVMYFAWAWLPEALTAAALTICLFFLFAYRDQQRVSHQLASTLTAVLYAGLAFGALALLHRDAGAAGPWWIVLALVVIWFSDTGAYFAGRAFGKHKLYEAVSPNKTVEGALGGVAASIGGAFACNYLFAMWSDSWVVLDWWAVLLVAVVGNALGQTGDLFESLVKRAHGVKDSGTIIYGHGGMLDRIDALIFAAPWFYYCFARILTTG